MRLCSALATLGVALALPFGSEAAACIPIAVAGPPQSDRERAESRRGWEREAAIAGLAAARADLARGADPAARLAEMLVPNIRPIRIFRSDCGVENEIDLADGEETVDDWLAGTPYAGRGEQFDFLFWSEERPTLGPTCNAEFRMGFAAFLRRRLSAGELRGAYLFLGRHWGPPANESNLRSRLVRFEGRTRRPPLRWHAGEGGGEASIRRWLRLMPTGRALKAALDDFWREAEPLLGDVSLACPAAAAAWPAQQARIVAEIETQIAAERPGAGRPAR
jgi:hypothetical protein